MIGHWWIFVKTLVKSSLDNYVLPGTLTGTEILFLYLIQWKRDLIVVTSATVYIISSQFELPKIEKILSRTAAIEAAPAAIPVNPKTAAISAITKNVNVQRSI